ncbi:MAG: hypothetical protein J5I98_17270 [Phaeodactylibacter sp.]|nr:hypothetical protein [Phaeodactylibacter sp.]
MQIKICLFVSGRRRVLAARASKYGNKTRPVEKLLPEEKKISCLSKKNFPFTHPNAPLAKKSVFLSKKGNIFISVRIND